MHESLRIFIGYDSKEPLAYHVLCHSILTRTTRPVSITPLALNQLGSIYTRKRGKLESTEFSMTRFLVPYLCDYRGLAIFMDCDMLVRCDIREVLDCLGDRDKAVYVCQHDYTPRDAVKFLGQPQTAYPRKNWSSFMVFNMNHYGCRNLTPQYVNEATGLQLHRFQWLEDKAIGALPLEWNWLVGEYPESTDAKVLHYTLGGPWFPEYRDCDHAQDWMGEYETLAKTMVP